jgi:hypothetical protein
MTDYNESSIETIVCEPMSKLQKQPLNAQQTNILMGLSLFAIQDEPLAIPEDKKPFIFQLIEKRLQLFTYTLDDLSIAWLTSFIASPGTAVLYMWYLQYMAKKLNKVNLTLDDLCLHIFPNGIFNEEDLSKIWRAQKVALSPDNLVDHHKYGKSVMIDLTKYHPEEAKRAND